jgi:AraC-like DNA-binding protein
MTKEAYPKIYLYRRIVQSKLFIDTNFAGNINLDNIADEAFFSKFHFIRLFKKIYGHTPHQYLTLVRIEKAKQLLKQENSISSVCFSVGFDSVSSFTGLFKKTTRLTPSVFQNQQHALKADIKKAPLKYIPNCFAEKKGWSAYTKETVSLEDQE